MLGLLCRQKLSRAHKKSRHLSMIPALAFGLSIAVVLAMCLH
jgi:hypothetical protein